MEQDEMADQAGRAARSAKSAHARASDPPANDRRSAVTNPRFLNPADPSFLIGPGRFLMSR